MAQLKEVQTLTGHQGRVWNAAWNKEGTLLASCGEDRTIRIWGKEGDRWACKTILSEGHERTIRSVAWSPCGNYLASASFDATVTIWSKSSGKMESIHTLEGHENEVKSVVWSPSGHYLASCSRDKSVIIWEMDDDEEFECGSILTIHTQDVKKVIWHPNADIVASCSYDDTIKMFKEDDSDWVCSGTLEGHESTVWGISFDKTGTRLASCSDDKSVRIWKEYKPGNSEGITTTGNDPTWKSVCVFTGYYPRVIYDISWCHLTDLLATAGGDNGVVILKEDSTNPNAPILSVDVSVNDAHDRDVNCVTWNPKVPGLLASAGDDEVIKLWNYISE